MQHLIKALVVDFKNMEKEKILRPIKKIIEIAMQPYDEIFLDNKNEVQNNFLKVTKEK